MASTSEVSFGARIANAEALSTNLKSFTNYEAPTPETSIASFDAFIATMKTENSNVATKKLAYSQAVDVRQKHFIKEPTSVEKILSPIVAAVRAKMGKSSKELADISALMTKIRGEKTTKPKEGDTQEKISQSERSYGSMTQNFANIVTTLQSLGANYTVVNANLKIPALLAKVADITAANNAVTTTFSALKSAIDTRANQYIILSERSQRIKEAVKSQYGVSATEYKLIKGLRV
ncbi:hypothetical protein ACFOWM_00440 [Ferruginibacter yonginensis]|uniref:Uncharacterized protein n=1 Tax=Ferruginibacter yonginensis TaxID=1310416 RepID=A0ABV8QLX9_9BACT